MWLDFVVNYRACANISTSLWSDAFWTADFSLLSLVCVCLFCYWEESASTHLYIHINATLSSVNGIWTLTVNSCKGLSKKMFTPKGWNTKRLLKFEQLFKTLWLHTLTNFVNSDKGKRGIIHYASEDHTLPDFKVVSITMNSRAWTWNVRLVARRHMTNENICVLKSAENIRHAWYPPIG